MLVELRVQNLLLMERAELLLGPGLNVITGETGAGKTMLAHALDLLLGGKPRKGMVRPGASEAYVEGLFEVPPDLFGDPDLAHLRERIGVDCEELVLARRVTAEGRSRAYLQGRSVAAGDLSAIGGRLLSFYGQHEHRKLTLASAQLDVLDGFCGAGQMELRTKYERAWSRAAALRGELSELRERAGARERDLDLLDFEIAEIEQAAPGELEESQLEAELARLESSEALRCAAAGAAAALESSADDAGAGGAGDRVAIATVELGRTRGIDSELDALAERCDSLMLEARELAAELARYAGSVESDPARLAAVAERLDLLARLKRKHGGTIEQVLEHAQRCRAERERLLNFAEETAGLELQIDGAEAELAALSERLTDARTQAAGKLSEAVQMELSELAMPGASFETKLVPAAAGEPGDGLGPKGAERVEFLIAPNSGVPAGPLREIASGGELSRTMLALMTIATGDAGSQTVVFDEVDAGVGGNTARAIGSRLRSLGEARQVVCITHLPQVASLASRHFRVTKTAPGRGSHGGGAAPIAQARVEQLDRGELVEELCRMLGAEPDDGAARRHAERLLEAA
jgi:DNA repair protein RecN (Recombination protein N)